MSTAITQAVVKGAALLDDDKPGWFNMLQAYQIDMASDRRCVLGQLYGTFEVGCAHFGWNMDEDLLVPGGAIEEHGFNCAYDNTDILRAEWIDIIRERQLASVES